MKRRSVNPDLIPILTETADGTVLDLPTLTETVSNKSTTAKPGILLTEEQCNKLAKRLFPELEAALREAIGSRSEKRWEKSMQQLQEMLPDLIRSAVLKRR
jgi:hypothetical protein